MNSGPLAAFVAAFGVLDDAVEKLVQRPAPMFCSRPDPKREQESSVCAGGACCRLFTAAQLQLELIAQHLERGQLTDEVWAPEIQHAADVSKLRERISGATEVAKLVPQTYEDDGLPYPLCRIAAGKAHAQVVEATRFTFGKAFALAAIAERDKLASPEFVKFAVGQAGASQEIRQPYAAAAGNRFSQAFVR